MFQAPRGTADTLPADQGYWRLFESRAVEMAARFGYERIDTPVFEDARLFVRGVGAVTDIVENETYTFEDRGGNMVTLRPEGTAPVCRAYLEHGMHNLPQPVRLYYFCPIFRYDRPQAGRLRQHHQFGVEALGDASPSLDAEVIELGWRLLESLGINDMSLKVNTIGDRSCKPDYIERLQAYYRPQVDHICPDCRRRMEENPLRLLDCKRESCQPVIEGAPHSTDFLCQPCTEHWEAFQGHLKAVGLSPEIDHTLVRGLDYYTRTVFEIVPPIEGRQSVIFGGGRYDGLIEELGGHPTPGVGFGMGIERVLLNLKRQGATVPHDGGAKVMIAHVGKAPMQEAIALASRMRRQGVPTVLGSEGRSLKSQLRYASAINATHAVIIGERELEKGVATVRDLARSEQKGVAFEDIPDLFQAR